MKKEQQPNPYRIDRLAMIPAPIKAIVLKMWFAGAVYYFIGLGIASLNTVSQLDLVLVLGIVLGMVTDIMVNGIFRFMRTDRNDYAPYMVFGDRKLRNFFLNILYNIGLSIAIAYTYNTINIIAMNVGWSEEGAVWLMAEPILYGLFYLMYDFMVLGIIALVRKMKNKNKELTH